MASSGGECPVCREPNAERRLVNSTVPSTGTLEDRSHADTGYWISCPACGEFVVTRQDDVNLKSPRQRSKWNAHHLSALLREQSIRPLPHFWLQYGMAPYGPLEETDLTPIDLDELLTRWPRTVAERIDRTLCNLAQLSPTAGHPIELDTHDIALAFAAKEEEARYHIDALLQYGFIKGTIYDDLTPSDFTLTPKGWSRFDELTRGLSAPENPVFVAMWFGGTKEDRSKMDAVYQTAIQPAIEQAGYRATRVDRAEHNDWIMDKVLGDIRLAPFVVADFTGNRNGVYFEAGFARGLGIPVIHSCQEDHLEQAHFDTKQLNHILWKLPDDLRTRLYHRIISTIGKGPRR